MKKYYQVLKQITFCFSLLLTSFISNGQSFSKATGNWDNSPTFIWAATAGGAASKVVPANGDAVTIQTGNAITLNAGQSYTCASLTVTGTLIFGAGSTLTVTGAVTGVGAIDMSNGGTLIIGGDNTHSGIFTPGTGTVNYNVNIAQKVRGATYNNLTISAGNTKTLQGATIVNGTLNISSSTLACGGNNLTLNSTVTLSSAVLTVGANTVTYAGASQTVIPATYSSLTLSGSGTKTLSGGTTVGATYTNTAVTLDAGNNDLTFNGTVTNTGTLTVTGSGTNTVTYGGGAQTVIGTTYNNLTLSGTGAKTLSAATVVSGTTSIAGTTTAVTLAGFNLTLNGSVTVAGTVTGLLSSTGTPTVLYSSSSAQDIIPGTYPGTLDLQGAGAKTLKGATIVTTTFNMASDLAAGANNLTLNGTITYTSGTFTVGLNTVTYGGAAQTLLPLTTYTNLTLSGSGNKTLANATTVNGTATISGTAAIVCGTYDLTFNGGVTSTTTGAISTGANTVTYSSGSAQNIVLGTYSGALTLSGAGAKNLTGATTVSGIFSMASALSTGNNALTLNGTVTYTPGALTVGTNTVTYGGASQTVIPATYSGLTLSGSGTKTLSGVTTVGATYTNTAVTLDAGNNDLTFNGTVTNTGSLTVGTNTVTYGGAAQTVIGTTYSSLVLQGSGAKTLQANTIVNGSTTVAGTVTVATGTNDLTFNNGVTAGSSNTITTGANTVTYAGTTAQDLLAGIYSGALTLSGASNKTMKANTTVTGTLTINSGSDLINNQLTLTTGGNININAGGTLELNSNSTTSAILSFNTTGRTITNAGTLKIVGVNTTFPSTIQTSTGTYNIVQSAATGNFIAAYYKFSNLAASGIAISAGTIDATNNFSNGLFNSGTAAGTYLNLTGFNATGMSNIQNVVFNAGPTYNVTRTSGTGAVTFESATGALAGENFDNDNGNPGTLVNWTAPGLTFYSQGNGVFSNLTNWNTSAGGGGSNPVSGDLTGQLATFIVQNGHTVTVDQNLDVLVIQVGQGTSGTLTIGNNTTARTITVRQSLETKSGATVNVGNFGATHILNIAANITNAGTINLYTSAVAVADVTFSGASAQIIGPNTPIFNNITFAAASNVTANVAINAQGTVTFAAGAIFQDGGFTHTVGGNWVQASVAQMTGTGTIEFNSTVSQTITTAATFNNLTFKGGAVGNMSANGVIVNGNFLVTNNTTVSTASNQSYRGSFTVNSGSSFTSTGTATFDGSSTQAIDASNSTFGAVTFTNGGALAKTIIGDMYTTGLVTISLGATVNGSGNESLGNGLTLNGTCNFSGTITFRGGTISSANSSITLGTAAIIFTTGNTFLGGTLIVNVNNNVTINTGGNVGLVLANNTSLVGSGNTFSLTSGYMYVRGANNFPTGFTSYSIAPTTTVIYDQAIDQTVHSGVTYGNISLTNNNKTADGALDIDGNVALGTSTTLLLGSYSHTIAGTINNSTTSSLTSTGTVTFDNPDANQTLGTGITYTFNNIVFTNTAPTASRTKTINANITVTGNFTATNTGGSNVLFNIIDLAGSAISGPGNTFTLGSNVYLYTSGTNTFATSMSNFSTVALNVTSTIRFNNTTNGTDQSIPGGFAYGNIELNGGSTSNTKTALASLDINGNFSRIGNTPNFIDGGFAHTVAGNWLLVSAYYTTPTSTITFDGTTQIIGPLNNTVQLMNVVFATGTNVSIIATPLNILGNLTINNGATVDADTKSINITGNWTNSGTGVFTQTTGTTTFNNTGADQTVSNSASSYFGYLIINKATGFKLTAITNITVQYDFTFASLSNSTFDGSNITAYIGRHWVFNTGSTYISTGGTLEFDGTVQQNLRNYGSATYNNLRFTGSGPQILYDNTFTLSGDLTITLGGLLNNSQSINITLAGNWSNAGSFLPGNGTVTFNGAAQNIGSSNFYNVVCAGTNTKTLTGSITLVNNLTISSGVTLDVSTSNYGIDISGNWDNSAAAAVFMPRAGTVTFKGNSATVTTGTSTGPAAGKSFYNVILNKTTGQVLSLGGDMDITADLTITAGTLTTSTFDIFVTGNFSNSDVFNQNNNSSSITLNATSGSKNFDPGTNVSNVFRDITVSASSAIYTLANNLTITNSRFLVINSGTFDLNGKVLSMSGNTAINAITLNGGILEVDAGAQLLLGNSNNILNQGGRFRVLGTLSSVATVGRNSTTGYTITQTSGTFEARYYIFQNLSYATSGAGAAGITISGGSIDATNNLGDGTFTGGFTNSLQYLDLTGFNAGSGITIKNVIFNGTAVTAGPAKNVKMTAGTGTVTFLNSSGNLAGYAYENDDLSATTGFLRWNRTGLFWTGLAGDNNFNTPGNWSLNVTPISTDTVYLDHTNVTGVYTVNITTADASVTRLVIDKGVSANSISLVLNNTYTLTVSENLNVLTGTILTATTASNTITVGGNWTVAGTFNPGTATVILNATAGTNPISMPAGGTFYNLTINGTGATYTLATALQVNNDFTLSNGTLDVTTGNYGLTVNGNWNMSGTGSFVPRAGTVTFAKTGNSTQTITGAPTFYNLTLSNATAGTTSVKQLSSNLSINGSVVIGANTQFNVGTNNVFVGLNWTNNSGTGAFVQTGVGILYFNGTSNQTIDNGSFATTFNQLILLNAGGKTWAASSTINGDLFISSGSGTVDVSTFTLTGAGTNTFTIAGNTQFNIRGANNFPQSFETISLASNSTVYYAANLDQTIYSTTYGNLNMNSTGAVAIKNKTAAGDLTVLGSISIADAFTRLDMATNNANITLAGGLSLTAGGPQITWGSTGTLTHNGAAWNISSVITGFNNLILTGTGTKAMLSNLAITGNVTVQSGVTLSMSTFTMTGAAGKIFTLSSGAILTSAVPATTGVAFPTTFGTFVIDASSTVNINGAANQTVATNITYGNLSITTASANATLNGNVIIAGNLVTGNTATIVDGGFNITVAGNADLRIYSPSSTSVLTLNGTTQLLYDGNTLGGTFQLDIANIVFAGSGTKTIGNGYNNTVNISGNLTVNSGVIVTSNRPINYSGSAWVNNGSWTSTGLLTYNGTGAQSIDPGTTNSFGSVTFANTAAAVTYTAHGGNFTGAFTINASAVAHMGTTTLTHNFSSTITNNGTWTTTNANLDFIGTNQTIPGNITARDILIGNSSGTKTMGGNWTIRNLTINAATALTTTASNYSITLSGDWTNNGTYNGNASTVTFNGSTSPVSITSGGSNFYDVVFTPGASVSYNLISTSTRFSRSMNIASAATLNLNSQTLILGSNIASGKIFTVAGTLNVNQNAYLKFNNQTSQSVMTVTGTLIIVGTSGNVATITREVAGVTGSETSISVTTGTIRAQYYLIEYLADAGLNLATTATVNNTDNFSNGTWSNLNTVGGTAKRYLVYDAPATSSTVTNVTFNFTGTPTVGVHYNVKRSVGTTGTLTFIDPINGTLGSYLYEDDQGGATSATLGGIRWPIITALTWTGATNRDWNVATNWNPNQIPTLSSDLTIPLVVNNPLITSADAVCKSLTITNGSLGMQNGYKLTTNSYIVIGTGTSAGVLSVSDPTCIINVGGAWTRGSGGTFSHGSGTVNFNGSSGSYTIAPLTSAFYNISFSGSTTIYSLSGTTINVAGNFVINDATVTPSTASYTLNLSKDYTNVSGVFSNSITGTAVLNGAAQTITASTFNNLTVSGTGTKTMAGVNTIAGVLTVNSTLAAAAGSSIAMNGNVTINSGGTFNDGGQNTHTFAGATWTGAGSYAGLGTVTFNRATGQTINGATFNNLVLASTNGNITLAGNVNIGGDLTLQMGTSGNSLLLSTYQITNTSGAGTMTINPNLQMQVSGVNNCPTGFADYEFDATSTTNYNAAFDQTVGGISYGNLSLTNATTKTLGGNIVVGGALNFNTATLDASTNNYSITIEGNWNNNSGSFTARAGDVTFDGTGTQTLSNNGAGTKTFNNLTVNKSAGTVNMNIATTVLGDLTVLSGIYDNNSYSTTVGGNFRATSGTFSNSGTYILNSTGGTVSVQTNGSTLGNLTINGAGATFTLQDNLTMNGNFTLTAGTFDGNSKYVSIGNGTRTIDISGIYKIGAGGTLALGSSSSLTVNSGGTIEVVGNFSSSAVVTHNGTGGKYTFVVNGTIKAQYYLFEYMNALGIQINSGATIDATNNFSNGTFTNGTTGGPYLRIENTQTIALISNVSFPLNPGAGAYNVMKTTALTGTITFDNSSGTFAGSAFENDPNNLINWTGPVTLTWTGATSTDWYTATNWSASSGPNIVPTGVENVIIAFHTNQPLINTAGALTKNLTINTSATLTVTTTTSATDLTVQGDMLINGSLVLSTSNDNISVAGNYSKTGSGTVNLNGTVSFTASSGTKVINNGTSPFYNLIVNGTAAFQLGANTTVNNNLNINAGSLDATGSNYTLTVKGNWTNSGGTFTPQAGTVTFNQTAAGTYTINNGSSAFFNIQITGGASTIYQVNTNALTANGNVTVNSGTLDLNGLTFNMGDGTGTDLLVLTSTLNINADAKLKMGANSSVSVNSGGVIKIVGNSLGHPATVTNQGTGSTYSFTVNSGGTIYAQYYLFEYMGISGIQVKFGAIINPTNNFSDGTFSNGFAGGRYLQLLNNFSDYTADSVVFNNGPTYNVSRTSGSGIITFLDAAGVKANYFYEDDDGTASGGLVRWIFTFNTLYWTGASNSDWNNGGNWQDILSNTGIIPDNTTNVIIPDVSAGSNVYPVLSSGIDGATKDLTLLTNTSLTIGGNKNLTVNGSFITNSPSTVTVNASSASTITVSNIWGVAGAFTANTSTVVLTAASGSNAISTGGAFYNLTLNGAGIFQTSGNTTVNNDLTISAGTLQVTSSAHTLTVGGNWSNSGTFTNGSGTVVLNKTTGTQTISGSTNNFYNLTLSTIGTNSKTVSLSNPVTISGNLNITGSNCTFSAGANTVTIKGNWTNAGKTFSSTGTVIFAGTSQQSISRNAGEIFKNLTINNTAAASPQVSLLKQVNVTGILTLTTGTLYTGTGAGLLFMDFSTAAIDKTGVGAISGKLTVSRTITPAGYHYFSSPLQGTTFADISDDTPYNVYNFFYFDQSVPNYVSAQYGLAAPSLTSKQYNGGPGNNLVGYALQFYGASTAFDMNGTYAHGVSYSSGTLGYNSTAPLAARGYHLIGNPYPSYIDWNSASITKTNLNAGITFYNCAVGQNADYTPDFGLGEAYINGASPYIPPMQAFWVQTNNTGASLTIGNNSRISTPSIDPKYSAPSYYRKASTSTPVIKLALENSIYSDEAVIRFGDLASENFDGLFDVYKQKNDAPCPSFYTESIEGQLSINSLPQLTPDREVPLIIDAPRTGLYTIRVKEISNIDAGMNVLLEDKLLNTIYDLKDSVYAFSMDKGDAQSRFVLKFKNSTITKIDDAKEIKELSVTMYSFGNEIKINLSNNNSKTANISVYDLLGHEVYKINNADVSNGNYSFVLPNNPASAVYVIKVVTDGHLYSDKLYLQPLK